MSDQDQPFDAYDPKAVEIIRTVIDGQLTPQEGAVRLLSYWTPKEFLHSDALPFIVQTRGDSLSTLDLSVIDLSHQGLRDQARRLAEMNWIIAKRSGDEELMVQCAPTLAQMMIGDPAAIHERLALLEFAVPKVVASPREDYIKAVMLGNLAGARFAEATGNPELLRASIDACQRALAINAPLEDFWLGRLNLVAGTAYNTIAESNEDLQSSINYLKAALKYYRADNYADEHAGALNNLGNSYRDLGQKTRDRNLLREAVTCYEQAMPFGNEYLKLCTSSNMAAAEKALAALDQASQPADVAEAVEPSSLPFAQQQKQSLKYNELLKAGAAAFHASQIEEDKENQFRRRAAAMLTEAMNTFGKNAGPEERAEGFHRLALLFVSSTEDDALWTGLCFASAAQRLSKESWGPLGQARVASHKGQMLMKIGYPRRLQYLLPAEPLLRNSIAPLQQLGHPGEAAQAEQYLTMTDHMLAISKVSAAEERIAASCAHEGMARLEAQSHTPPTDELQRTYYVYISLVKKLAATELRELLGQLGLEATTTRFDYELGESYRALQFIRIAAKHREIGDLEGALSLCEEAEDFAQSARYSAPSIWCELAGFYHPVPLPDEARRCIQRAEHVMNLVVEKGEYVAEGETSGHWMPQAGEETYQAEIEKTKALIRQIPSTPRFDPARTVELLAVKDKTRHQELQRTLQRVAARTDLS